MARILFVDDDEYTMANYVEELREQDHEVSYCSNVDSAMQKIDDDKEQFDLVIWDLSMPPGRSFARSETQAGLKTGERLREYLRDHRPEVPRLLFTNFRTLVAAWNRPDENDRAAAKRELLPWELGELVHQIVGEKRGE